MKQLICRHFNQKNGPRFPATYGSYATRICEICGAWKLLTSGENKWRHTDFKSELKQAILNDKER